MEKNLNLFLHIPKAAGTTLLQIINQIYPKSKHYSFDTAKSEYCIDVLKHLSIKQKQNFKIVSGHISFGFHNYFEPNNFKYFTILRNPTDRIVSHYYYSARKTNHYLYSLRKEKDISLKEYVQSGITNEVNNGMAKQIAGLYVNDNFGYYNLDKSVLSDSELFDRAVKNLESYFSVIGLMEEFDKFLILLKENLHMPLINFKYSTKNQAQIKPKKLTDEELEIIYTYNKVDFKLYDYCKKRFNEKWNEHNHSMSYNFNPNYLEKIFLKSKRIIHKFL